ncbi:MAG: YifB family Mg chelatase-like AAA ATPase [Elusimicrobiota bacterium]
MPLSIGTSFSLFGVEAYPVRVEVDIRKGLPSYTTVGLGDKAVKESKNRVNAAIKNSGYDFPVKKITVNLAPASVKKEGSAFDFPIALGILGAGGVIKKGALEGVACLGELSLDGSLRGIRGALSVARALKRRKMSTLLLPDENKKEASAVRGIRVFGIKTLKEAVEFLNGAKSIEPFSFDIESEFNNSFSYDCDFSDIKGQYMAKRAAEIAAAGFHNILMTGPPGSGKTMLARRINTILPPLGLKEALQVSLVHSAAGSMPRGKALVSFRPFRSPHHTISDIALAGGGNVPRPGEISMAHRGVLFLDEFPEFKRQAVEVIRQPLEERRITVSRALHSVSYPASFMLVAAMNPCPCGFRGVENRECSCSPAEIKKYRSRISGPIMDRIDMHVYVPPVSRKEIEAMQAGESSKTVMKRVIRARALQKERFCGYENIFSNAEMKAKMIEKCCRLSVKARKLMASAVELYGLSVRGYNKGLKVARTIADLQEEEEIKQSHVAEALQYRISYDS